MLRHSSRFGFSADEPKLTFSRLRAHLDGVVRDLAPSVSREHAEALGATVLSGSARFVDRMRLAVGDTTIRAGRYIIATGSRPILPQIPGLSTVDPLTSDTVFALDVLPEHLVVLGGGRTGIAIAQAFRRLGSAVTVVDIREPLGDEDPEIAAIALRRLAAEGVKLEAHTGVVAVRPSSEGIELALKSGAEEWTIEASHLVVAAGRSADIEDLALALARITATERGIVVDRNLRTTNLRVYAIGDVIDGQRLASRAAHEGERVVRGGKPSAAIASATWTDPEIAHVGLTEPMLRDRNGDRYRVLRYPFAQNVRAQTLRQAEGLIKLVTDPRGRILGASIVGPLASETIALFALAIDRRMTVGDLAGFAPPSPTLAEAVRQLARDAGTVPRQGGGSEPRGLFRRLLP